MHVPHVNEVRKTVGSSILNLLRTIFEQSVGIPPSVPATRFRADNPQWMDELHNMGYSSFLIKTDPEEDTYRISAYSVPLIDSKRASEILANMQTIYQYLPKHYAEHLRQPLSVAEIERAVNLEHEQVLETLFYMRDVDGWWSGLSAGFPAEPSSTVVVNEQVLKYGSFADLISRVYEWNFINPKEQVETWWHQGRTAEIADRHGFFTTNESTEYPAWFAQLDDAKKALIGEIDVAMRRSLLALPTIGLRTLIERVMVEHVGEDGGFSEKLSRFQQNGYVTSLHADSLRKVLDVGHASVHRAYFPNEEDVRTCVEVAKHLMHGLYVLHPRVQAMATNTPEDPRRIKKGPSNS